MVGSRLTGILTSDGKLGLASANMENMTSSVQFENGKGWNLIRVRSFADKEIDRLMLRKEANAPSTMRTYNVRSRKLSIS